MRSTYSFEQEEAAEVGEEPVKFVEKKLSQFGYPYEADNWSQSIEITAANRIAGAIGNWMMESH